MLLLYNYFCSCSPPCPHPQTNIKWSLEYSYQVLFVDYFGIIIVAISNSCCGLYCVSSSILSDLHASTYLIFIRFLRGRYNFHPHRRGKRGGDGDIKSNWECPESNPRLQALEPMLLAIALYCFSTGVQVRHLLLSLYFEFLIDDYVSLKKKKKVSTKL